MNKWEYLSVDRERVLMTDKELNAIGEQGWELVGVYSLMPNNASHVRYKFKRPYTQKFATVQWTCERPGGCSCRDYVPNARSGCPYYKKTGDGVGYVRGG